MSIRYKVNKAEKILQSLTDSETRGLERICGSIQHSQERLNASGKELFQLCLTQCQGLCCQNVQPDDIITQLDMVFILAIHRTLRPRLLECARDEPLFTADCIFLENGTGPCLFPSSVKPERCIITFCSDTTPIAHEIKRVRSRFSQLKRFILFRKPLLWLGF